MINSYVVLRHVRAGVTAAACASAFLLVAPGSASATGITAGGSIVYAKGGDVYLTLPDGSAQVRVTTDGNTPTGDDTGDTGYRVPSESDSGLIVAVRNQEFNAGQADEYTQGYLWEMDRSGKVIRKFKPPQFDYIPGGSCSPAVQELPLGIVNAAISPDGKYVGYTAQTYVQTAACDVVQGYSSWIVKVDGTGGQLLATDQGNTASLEIGQWTADSTKLLLDDADFGSVADYYVSVPGFGTHLWTAQTDLLNPDSAYGQPDVRGGILATEGYSPYTNRNAMRLWTTSGFSTDPSAQCDYSSPVADGGVNALELISRPSLAPDGSYVAWEDSSSDGTVGKTGQGIYLVSTNTINNGCSTASTLLVQGGEDPFWTSAGLYGPPVVSFTAQPPALTNSTSAHVQFTATDPDPARHILSYTCSLDGAAPQTCTSPRDLSGLTDGAHTLAVVADDGAQTGRAQISWQVDTSAPAAALTTPTSPALAGTSTRIGWHGSDSGSGIASYELRYRRASYTGGFGAWTERAGWHQLTGSALTAGGLQAGYDYCWSVRAVDRAANVGPWSAPRCTAVALDDRSLSRSAGWKFASGASYYAHTVTSTTAKGATLSRSNASVDRVGIVATTCGSCGQVAIYVGKQQIGTVNLHASGTHHKVIKMLPSFALRSGTVSVKVLTSGKSVAIDGLVLSRT